MQKNSDETTGELDQRNYGGMKVRMIRLGCLVLLALLSLCIGGCTTLFFQPQSKHVLSPAQLNLEFEDVYFDSTDGIRLHGWFLPAKSQAKGTILFAHGNGENISTHIASIYWLPASGYNVFAFDYRGYGRSQGKPDIDGAMADFETALQTLVTRRDIDANRIVVLGQSLGGAIAIAAVAQSPLRSHIKAVVADSAFSSYRAITREKMSEFILAWPLQWLPWLTMTDKYSPIDSISLLSPIPVLIMHSEKDQIVPVHHASRLFDAAQEPRKLLLLPSGNHIEALTHQANREYLTGYLEKVLEAPSGN